MAAFIVWLSHSPSDPPREQDLSRLSTTGDQPETAPEQPAKAQPQDQLRTKDPSSEIGADSPPLSDQQTDIAFPTTAAEVRLFLRNSLNRSGSMAFFSVVDSAFDAESRSNVWANQVEEVMARGLSAGDVQVRSGECRASLCRYVLVTENPSLMLLRIGQQFTGAPSPGADAYLGPKGPSPATWTVFIFSLDPAAPYLVHMYKTLEDMN